MHSSVGALRCPPDRDPSAADNPAKMAALVYCAPDYRETEELLDAGFAPEAATLPHSTLVIAPQLLAALPELAQLVDSQAATAAAGLALHSRAAAVPAQIEAAAAAALRQQSDCLEQLAAAAINCDRRALVTRAAYREFCNGPAARAYAAARADVADAVRGDLCARTRLVGTTVTTTGGAAELACRLGRQCTAAAACTVSVSTPRHPPLHVASCEHCARLAMVLWYTGCPYDTFRRGDAPRLRLLLGDGGGCCGAPLVAQ